MLTTHQVAALIAAYRQVHYPSSEAELDREFAWVLKEAVIDSRYHRIVWRRFPLGQALFFQLAEAQNWRCCYCGVRTNEWNAPKPTIEHVVSLATGGLDHPDNMAMVCLPCNRNQDPLFGFRRFAGSRRLGDVR
jgi:hypothetical protein